MKHPIIILTISFFVAYPFFLTAQEEATQAYAKGIRHMNGGRFDKAIEEFKTAVNIKNDYKDAWYHLGLSFNLSRKYDDAVYSFGRLISIDPNHNANMYYEASKALIATNKLSDAADAANAYLQRLEDTPDNVLNRHKGRNRLLYATQSPEIRKKENTMSEPVLISSINSNAGDYMPQVNPTGTKLYFTSVRQGGFDNLKEGMDNNYGEDLYISTLIDSSWSMPNLLPEPLNSMGDDFGSAFTGDGQLMIYVRCGTEESIGNCDLYYTELLGTRWTEPKNMGNVVNSDNWDSQPTISSDGTRIIFASARDGGYGGMDLYMVDKTPEGVWGIPQNLGGTVNTPYNENSPYLAPDGKTLYYSSNGHPGFGGMDIFYCVFENGRWSKPINLGAPLNSEGDDTNFSISALGMGYFSSSRIDNDYQIFEIELPDELKPKPTVVVQGIVSNAKTEAPLEAVVLIEDINSGELLSVNKSNSSSGEYLVVLPAGRDYSLSATSKGYFFYSESFQLPADTSYQEIDLNISLEPIEKGTKVVLNNIFFESGRAELKPISYVELNKAVDLLKDNPSMIIEIGGHTDNVGSEALNQQLSQKRAQAVVDYMILAGIDASRLQAKGYGESTPIADNSTAEGKAKNRRTEFEIVEF